MSNKDFFKERYAHLWDVSSQKEILVKSCIEQETGLDVFFFGLGAGSNQLFPGSAKENGHAKGDPDLHIKDLEYFIEVTGPNVPKYKTAPLWFKPHKIDNARARFYEGQITFFIHLQECKQTKEKLIRVIPIDGYFLNRFDRGYFKTVIIPGHGKFYEIVPGDDCIISFQQFINLLKLKA